MKLFISIMLTLALAFTAQAQDAKLGQSIAADFGRWTTKSTEAIASGAQQMTTAQGSFIAGAGVEFSPFFVGNLLTITDPVGGTENVTITASACGSNSVPCKFTATFVHAHAANVVISSRTHGVQEALNAATARGGSVLITSAFTGATTDFTTTPTAGATTISVKDVRSGVEKWYGWTGSAYTAVLTVGATTAVVGSSGAISGTSVTDAGLTATRVPFAGTAGLLADDADMTFATDTLTVTKLIGSTSITDSGLTATRVAFAGTAGLLADDADLTFVTDTLTATKLVTTSIVDNGVIKTDTTTAHTLLFQAYDVDGTTYRTFATLTNGNTPSFALAPPSGGTLTLDATSYSVGGAAGATGSIAGTITVVNGIVTCVGAMCS